jgi:hypothetical protein
MLAGLVLTLYVAVPDAQLSTKEASSRSDVVVVDEYLSKWDRFARGENDLVPELNAGAARFESALSRLLRARDKRGPARLVFYPVVQVGGGIVTDSELGRAAAAVLGKDFPITVMKDRTRVYFAGDLYLWWEREGGRHEAFPLFDEWRARELAQTVVIPQYRRMSRR